MSANPKGNVKYNGTFSPLFKSALWFNILAILTLGIYRFWGKTRIRKYIWSSVKIDNDALEYTGTGLEKFLGFLVAIICLTIYLGIIQVLLGFVGLSILSNPENPLIMTLSFYASFFASMPLILFASYRSRRYKLARTRFRGIRFGMSSEAWGYVWRALGHMFLTMITLGIMMPRQTFYLEKYLTDRSFYGDARFDQKGRWQDLYRGMKHMAFAFATLVLGAIAMRAEVPFLGPILILLGYFWMIGGALYYNVHSFAYLTKHKTLGNDVTFDANPSTRTLLRIVITNTILLGLIMGVYGAIFLVFFWSSASVVFSPGYYSDGVAAGIGLFTALMMFLSYIFAFCLFGALNLAMIIQPIIAHFVGSLQVNNMEALDNIRQRAADKGADADGFADALDIGGAI